MFLRCVASIAFSAVRSLHPRTRHQIDPSIISSTTVSC